MARLNVSMDVWYGGQLSEDWKMYLDGQCKSFESLDITYWDTGVCSTTYTNMLTSRPRILLGVIQKPISSSLSRPKKMLGPSKLKGPVLPHWLHTLISGPDVGSLSSKSYELVETLRKSKVGILCVQETRWKGQEAVNIDDYRLWFSGSTVARNGVGIIIRHPYKDNIVGVGRCSDRIMSIRLVIREETYMVISAYAPHAGLGEEEKRSFWDSLDEVVRSCPADHRLLIGGDLNRHIGTDSDGYTGVHGGFGYGVRNEEGRSILDFAVAHDLVVTNSFFRKTEAQLATLHIGGHSTQIDYILLRKGNLRRRVTRCVRPVQPKILWKNLNGVKAETFKALVMERVEVGVDTVNHGDADQMWNSLASTIRDVAKEALGVAVRTSRGHKS
ncbi:uncharacterized protein [Rutidosis leptorrhynchoides]|uniref:uncharacterized protein n=1 Tax=Rutidosis leptorrhynchoides TaxID=125765 RepID=UPI003A99C866